MRTAPPESVRGRPAAAAPAATGRPVAVAGRRAAPARPARWAVVAGPAAIVVVTGWTHRWLFEDGFIYLRVVEQLLAGEGPVFNAGERVEAYTSPAWLAVLALGDLLLPIRLEWVAVLLGLALAAAGIAAATAGALRLTAPAEGGHRWPLPAGALVAVAPFASWIWHTSGMETGLIWAWLGACLLVLARWAADGGRTLGRLGLVLAGLGWLVRPELVLLSALFVLVVLAGEWRTSTWRRRASTVAWMVALPFAYQVFRMGYFGLLVADTALAKEGTRIRWDRGVLYLRDYLDPYWLWLPLLVLTVGAYLPAAARAGNRQRLVLAAFPAGGLLAAAHAVAIGGDYLHGRFFVAPLFAVCAPVAAVWVERRYLATALLVPWALAALFVLRPRYIAGGIVGTSILGRVTVEENGWSDDLAPVEGADLLVERLAPLRLTLRWDPAPFEPADGLPRPAILGSAVGLMPYAVGTEVHVVDAMGLAHPVFSHFELVANRPRLAGHEKPAPAPWLAADVAAPGQRVDPEQVAVAEGGHGSLIPPTEGEAFLAEVADARAALDCEPVRRLRDAARDRLDLGRFLRNLFQAPANTVLRIPPDPAEARADLC